MKVINFSHKYDKLDDNIFTTIRGKSKIFRMHTGEFVEVRLKGKLLYTAKIIELTLMKIKELPMELLRKDIAPFKMRTRGDFIKLLNTFRKYKKIESTDEMLTIIKLKKEIYYGNSI